MIKLYLVTDSNMIGNKNLEDIVIEAVKGGVTIVQLREKEIDVKRYLDKGINLKKKLDISKIPLIINDRVDVTFAVKASGVHLGQSDLPLSSAREILGRNCLIGISISTIEEARIAESNGADYIAISPVFDTPTKTDTDPAVGLEGIFKIRKNVKLPIVGIGGINIKNAREVIKAGCDGIAVVSAIISAENPKQAARDLLEEIEKGLKDRQNNTSFP